MPVEVKNPILKKKVFREMEKFDNKAFKAYKKGEMKLGKKFEAKSDKLYSKNYYKMFKVTKVK